MIMYNKVKDNIVSVTLGTFTSCESPSVSLFLYSIDSEPEFN